MEFPQQYTLYIILAPLTIFISAILMAYVRSYYLSAETAALTRLLLIICGWLLFNSLELIDPTETGTVFWAKMSYGFITFTSVAWFAFALQYSNHLHWLIPSRFYLFCLIPTATTVIAWTNEWHHLLWQAYIFIPVGNLLALSVEHGSWFWVHAIYSYTLVFGGATLIILKYFQSFALYRRQSTWVVIGVIIPISVNVIYLFNLIPVLKKDYTAVSFALAAMALAVGVFRYRLFDLKPVARDVVIDSIKEAMITLDLQERIVDLNPASHMVINGPLDSAIGRLASEVLTPWGDIQTYLQTQTDVQGEIWLGHEQTRRYYDLLVSPLFNRRGGLTGRLVILHDITPLKQAETTLRKYTADLEIRNEELDAFSYTVAHDLKNLLAVQLGYSELLQTRMSGIPIKDAERYLGNITRTSRKMISIINELMLLAKVRSVTDIEVVPLDTPKIIQEALIRLEEQIQEHEAQVACPASWPAAVGYGPWVEEVWANYISNAVKYGGKRPIVELGANETRDIHSQKPMIRFWVRDNGPGIPADKQTQLFTLFTRLTPGSRDGHGLGLTIVQRIVTKLGGDVGVESTDGSGSLFWFTLPANQ